MRQKIIAAVVGTGLVGLAAVGAFASQDAVDLGGGHISALEVTETATDTATATDTVTVDETATDTPTATETPTPEATETETATPEATATGEGDDDGEREIKGIPTTNPSHHPEDGDGECEKGETVVKTTPSGVQVNVPCQAAGDHGESKDHNPHADDEGGETEEAD